MKLYYFPPSPNCRRVLAAMYHLGSNIELQIADLASEKFDHVSFAKKNPNGMVPLLEDGDFRLWEGNAIMQYLASKKGDTDLFPQDIKSRADISRWQCWQLAHFGPACGTLTWENMLKGMFGEGGPDAAEVKEGTEQFRTFAQVLDTQLSSHKFITGDKPTLADYSVAASMMYWKEAKIPVSEFKNIGAWWTRIEQLDAWKKSAPPKMN